METQWFYRVESSVTTFVTQSKEGDDCIIDFKGPNLKQCKEDAHKCYVRKSLEFANNPGYMMGTMPFASADDFIVGTNAAYSLTLALVESGTYSDSAFGESEDYECEYFLAGEDDELLEESLQIEKDVLSDN